MNWKASIAIILLFVGIIYMYFFADPEQRKIVFWLYVGAIGVYLFYKIYTAMFKPS